MDTPSKPLPASERRAVTVEAVVSLAAEQNPGDITTAAIAQRMGLTQGAIFRHFPDKASIVQAVLDWVAERLMSRVDRAARGAADPLEALEAVFTAHIAFVADHPGAPRLLLSELQRAGDSTAKRMARTVIADYGERIARLLRQGQDAGRIDPALDVDAASTLYVGMVQGLVIRSLASGETASLTLEAPKVFALFRRGVERRP